jgi:hypothetical protein
METLFDVLFAAAVGCTLLATLRIAVVGLGHMPANPVARVVSHDYWAAMLIMLLPWLVGGFARREISALPWVEFTNAHATHGIVDGILSVAMVLVVDLWLLWVPAHSYVTNRPDLDKRTATMARGLNLAVGLLLLTPHNPLYWLLGGR